MQELSVIIPVYNESRTLNEIIGRVQAVETVGEIIIVDDGSTDGTRQMLAQEVEGRDGIKVLYHERNQGKGAAIRTALREVTGQAVIIQDADLEYDPNDYERLLAVFDPISQPVVYGSRNLGQPEGVASFSFYWGGRLISLAASLLYGTTITDEPTCYKLFATELILKTPLVCTGFEFCPEITAKILRQGHTIKEVPIHYRPRSVAEGKKIRWRDGAVALWTLLKYRFWNPPR